MYCQACGAQVSSGAKFCPKCGASQEAAVSKKKHRIPTFVLFIGPWIALVLIIALWGLASVLSAASGAVPSAGFRFFKIIMPLLILVTVSLIPIGMVFGIARLLDKS